MKPTIELKLLNEWAKVPAYATDGSAAVDLCASIPWPVWIEPGKNLLIPTGISIRIGTPDIVGVLASRSGHGLNFKVRLGNGIGVIDSDYQQEIGVILFNDGDTAFEVMPGDRIAQLMFVPVHQVNLMVVNEFSAESGRGGFGSTGK